ncbi:MAG: PKD domain-containing protein, partial [Chitinophagaceae bacterium]|nr:PKD domain-containing protein [Chitinophagaceae bacterium]
MLISLNYSQLRKLFTTILPGILAVFGLALLASGNAFAQTPSANFTATPISGCSPLIVQFQDLSSGSPTAWAWDLGNGSTSTLQHPQTTYFLPGTYSVRLTVTNASGSNTLTRTQYITVHALPTVNFSADQVAGCFPFRNQFTDLSAGVAGSNIVNWQWDFGNGVTSSLQNPSAVYPTAGSFAVTLKVTDDKGCSKILGRSSYINVSPGVTAAFSPNPAIACVAPANVAFNNTSAGPGTLSYVWDFGDGGSSSLPSPSYVYGATGTYNVSLTVSSSSGCRDTVRSTVSVGGFTSSFQTSGTACPGSGISFLNTSTPKADSVRWTFGDGNSSTDTMPTNVYLTAGTYTVWLYNYYGNCIDSTSQQFTINTPPVANFTATGTGTCQPTFAVNFQDLSTGAVSWQWSFGDGNTSGLQNPAHTYNGYGSYDVTLVITNNNGCLDTLTMPGFIRLQRPVITVPQVPANGCIPFSFSPVPVINSPDVITSFLWDFGDGTTSTLQTPTHVYPVQGAYTVKLYYTSSTGCTDSLIFANGVRVGSKPVADFSATPLVACASETINFTNLSSPYDQLLWNFGDGAVSSDINPTHVYTDTGHFNIQLIATNSGCPDTSIRPRLIQILPPISRFSAMIDCGNRRSFSFTDESILPQTWLWDFGDGTTSTTQNPSHTFPSFDTWRVSLTVTNGSCTHTSFKNILVAPQPFDFNASLPSVCRGLPVSFTPLNVSQFVTASLVWNFGDGTESSSFGFGPATHIYNAAGVYTVMLIAVDGYGCRDTLTKTAFMPVYGPTANFTATPPGGCTGNNILFTDQTLTDGTHAITNWLWDFGDGSTQSFNAPPFTHSYSTNDSFSIKLTVTDAAGCMDTLTRPSFIKTTTPLVSFEPSLTQVCAGAVMSFNNNSSPSTSFWDFGDGNTSTDHWPFYAYADTGFYTVKLVITDSAGCKDSLIKTNAVHIILPQASFVVNDSFSACTPLEVQFTNTSKYGLLFNWDFGPGEGNSSLENPVHYYSTPGTYRVKLVITSQGSCQDSAFINITVLDTAGINLSYTPIDGCNPLLVNFTATGPVSTQSYFWDFGDGSQLTTTP